MSRRRVWGAAALLALPIAGLLSGCSGIDSIPILAPPSPYESYSRSLEQAELTQTRVGSAWLTAGEVALQQPVPLALPFNEVVYFDPREPRAVAYRVELRRGQRLVASVTLPEVGSGLCFIDLFALDPEGGAEDGTLPELRRVAQADELPTRLTYTIEDDGVYLLRVQPELLAGGPHTLTVVSEPTLDFPVAGGSERNVGSGFGDPRSGGRRHEGVDIFAPRGTPAIAASEGFVTRVGTNELGGKVVWMRSSEGLSLYYAHLDEQRVSTGARVVSGETLGLVGNTGNARTTNPHLHFGVFDGGALDPFPFLHRARPPGLVTADLALLGGWARVRSRRVNFRQGPSDSAGVITQLPQGTPLKVQAADGGWYQAALPDGRAGFVFAELTEPATNPLRHLALDPGRPLTDRPGPGGIVLADLATGSRLAVLGHFEENLLVRTAEGRTGWI